MAQTTVKLDQPERDAIKRLQSALQKEIGLKANREEIVAALLHGTTPAQLAGMLLEWNRQTQGD